MDFSFLRRSRAVPLLLALTLSAAILSSCAGRERRAPGPDTDEIWIVDGAFEPNVRNILPGDRITWINRDTVAHTVTSGINKPDERFESGEIPPGGRFEYTFHRNGVFQYYCSIHPETMRGTVIVGVSENDLPIGR